MNDILNRNLRHYKHANCLHLTTPCLFIDCEKVGKKWCRCGSPKNDGNAKHERILTPPTHTHTRAYIYRYIISECVCGCVGRTIFTSKYNKSNNHQENSKRNSFLQTLYYFRILSIDGSYSTNASMVHVLIFVLSLCSLEIVCFRLHTHAHLSLIFYSLFPFQLAHFSFEACITLLLLSHLVLFLFFIFSIILFLIMVSFFKQFDNLSVVCSNAHISFTALVDGLK